MMLGDRWHNRSILDGGPVKGRVRLLEKVWIFLEDSPEEVNYMGLIGRA